MERNCRDRRNGAMENVKGAKTKSDQEEKRDSRDGSEVPASSEKVLEAGAMYIPFTG